MAKTELTSKLISRFERLSGRRQNWETHWQEVADYMQPRKADVTKKELEVIREWNKFLIHHQYKQ